jgi:ribosome recycling factor
MLDDIKKDARERMAKCVATFQNDMKKLRTGRAHPSLIEHLKVDYYGNDTPLNQVANIAVEDGRTARVAVRNVRRDVMQDIKELLKEKLISQDDEKRAEVEVQKLTDKHVAEIEQHLTAKEKEVMQI